MYLNEFVLRGWMHGGDHKNLQVLLVPTNTNSGTFLRHNNASSDWSHFQEPRDLEKCLAGVGVFNHKS
jgi:hypothetical protein